MSTWMQCWAELSRVGARLPRLNAGLTSWGSCCVDGTSVVVNVILAARHASWSKHSQSIGSSYRKYLRKNIQKRKKEILNWKKKSRLRYRQILVIKQFFLSKTVNWKLVQMCSLLMPTFVSNFSSLGSTV